MTRTAYEIAADDLVSVLYHNPTEYFNIRFKHNLLPALMPEGAHRAFTQAVYELYEQGKPIHDTLVIDLAPSITPQWLAERVTLYDDTRVGNVVAHNVDIVRREGLLLGTQRLLRIADGQLADKGATERTKIVSRLMSALSTVGIDAKAEAVIATEHAQLNRYKDADSVDGHKSGIHFIDSHTNGYEAGHIWWIGGAYKARKTTLMLNMLLGACMMPDNNISPAFLSREMMQDRVQRQLESMLAIAWIYKGGYYGKTYKNHNGSVIGYDWITPALIKQVNRRFARLTGEEQYQAYKQMLGDVRGHALYWAQRQYDKLKLRIYDTTPEHGNLSDYHSVEGAINMDIVTYGGNWFGVDYLQLIDAPGNIFEQVSAMSKGFQTLAQRKKVTMLVLAQLNEDSIKNGESYSPGVKGGGDPAQTADYFLRTRYNDSQVTSSDTELSLQMKLTRHGSTGQEIVNIHPASGLILEQDWIKGLEV